MPTDDGPITGGQLKERVKAIQGTSKKHQIVVVVDSNFVVEKIVHDETRLSDCDMNNVYVLECSSGAVDIDVQVRWPKNSWETPQQQIVKLQLHLDDKVSRIKRSVESTTNIKITDSVIYINGIEIEDEEKSLAHYHCVQIP